MRPWTACFLDGLTVAPPAPLDKCWRRAPSTAASVFITDLCLIPRSALSSTVMFLPSSPLFLKYWISLRLK